MYVNTPGFRPYSPADVDLTADQNGLIGVVLETYATPESRSFLPGPRCSVLLVDPLQVKWDVLVTPVNGGSASNLETGHVSPTDPELLIQINDALNGKGVMPSPSSSNAKWGSWITIDRIGTGKMTQLVIGKYLYHPATAAKRLPVLPAGNSAREEATKAAIAGLVAFPDELPDSIADPDSVPTGIAPFAFSAPSLMKASWQSSYRAGWSAGAESAYLGSSIVNRETGAESYIGLYAAAQSDGWRTGWDDGMIAGAQALKETPPESNTSVAAITDDVPDVEEPGDVDGDGAKAAVTTGDDKVIDHYGNRIHLYQNGGIRIDSRGAGPIEIQGGEGGSRLTAGGAIIDVGNGGKTVVVTADMINLGGIGDRVILGYKFLRGYLDHKHICNGAMSEKSDHQFLMDEMLAERVTVK